MSRIPESRKTLESGAGGPGLSLVPVRGLAVQVGLHARHKVGDDQGQTATSRLYGPEAGVVWTSRAAPACVEKVLSANALVGFLTPDGAYGADFVMECMGVAREDLDGEEEPAA